MIRRALLIVLSTLAHHRHGRQVAAAAGQRSQLGKDSERLAESGHFVIIAHIHFLGGISHMRFFSSNSVHIASRNSRAAPWSSDQL